MKNKDYIYLGIAVVAYFLFFNKKNGIGTVAFKRYDELKEFTKKELNNYLQKYFPDTFPIEIYEIKKGERVPIPNFEKKAPENLKFSFFDHLDYIVNQSGENTYIYFSVNSDEGEFVVRYGMKDYGDVDKQMVPTVLNWLMSVHNVKF